MSLKYDVRWTETAEKDLEAIVVFIANDGVDKALNILETIQTKVAALNHLPERGRVVPELKDQGITLYREIVVAPWRILFRISGLSVYVLAVLDSRRNLEDILLNRFVER